MSARYLLPLLFSLACLASCSSQDVKSPGITISVIGTNDVHGEIQSRGRRGGLTTISGYVDAVRKARAEDGGAIVLVDAGDAWQGTLQSNVNEGAAIVAAFNAMGYDAAAIGNHEFDFGPIGEAAIPQTENDDPQGALKLRASEAQYPLLAANLVDTETGKRMPWKNVRPSILVEKQGISVGIIGVMTRDALAATISANVEGLSIAPLAATIEKEARDLRARGAALIIVAAHAGGTCANFDNPMDLSSCNNNSEIFAVARALPTGLVDHIVAGHVHYGIAHSVNGIAITSSFSNTRAFGRVDFLIDKKSGAIIERNIFAPQQARPDMPYEGNTATANPRVVAIAARTAAVVTEIQKRPVGVTLDQDFTLANSPDSTLGNLFTRTMLDAFAHDADIAMINVVGGLRTGISAGELTYGQLFFTTPFDNRVVILQLSGAELRTVVASAAHLGERTVGFAGIRVSIECDGNAMSVSMKRDNGSEILDEDSIRVATTDYIALGGMKVLTAVTPAGGFTIDNTMPTFRDAIAEQLSKRGGTLFARDFDGRKQPVWTRPVDLDKRCKLPGS